MKYFKLISSLMLMFFLLGCNYQKEKNVQEETAKPKNPSKN
jgi:hypothetical protein